MAPTSDVPSAYGEHGVTMMGLLWTEFVIAAALVFARLYTNSRIVGEFGWDFFWAVLSLIVGTVSQCFLCVAVNYGIGRHVDALSPEQTSLAIKWVWVAMSTTITAIALGKLVVISFILRVQGATHVKGTWFLWFLAVTNLAINFFETVLVMFQCSPTKKLWEPNTPGNCHIRENVNHYSGFLQGAWNAATDLALAIYPVFIFARLQMPLKLKIGVSTLMATGLFTAICAAMKTWEIRQVSVTQDVTFALTPLVLWNSTEFWVTLIAGSLPPIWPTVMYFYRKHRGQLTTKGGSGQLRYAGNSHQDHGNHRISIPLRSKFNGRSRAGNEVLSSRGSEERLRDPNEIHKMTSITIRQEETTGDSPKATSHSPDTELNIFPEPQQYRGR